MTFDLTLEVPTGTGDQTLREFENVDSYLAVPGTGKARVTTDGETETVPYCNVVSIDHND